MRPRTTHWLLRCYADRFETRTRPDDLLLMKCDVQMALKPLSRKHEKAIHHLYIEGLPLRETMEELSVGRRLLMKLRNEALAAIAEHLGDEYEAWVP